MKRAFLASLSWAFLMAVVAPVRATTVYTSTNSGSISSFGPSVLDSGAYVGEEFTAPGGALQSITFYSTTGYQSNPGNIDFVVQSWNGTESIGPALYTAMVTSWLGTANETLTVSGINLSLSAGSQYIAYLAFAGIPNPGSIGVLETGSSTSNSLPGALYYLGTSAGGPVAPAGAWSGSDFPGQQLTYSATFGAALSTPEPAAFALLGTGLAGVFAVRRRRAIAPVTGF